MGCFSTPHPPKLPPPPPSPPGEAEAGLSKDAMKQRLKRQRRRSQTVLAGELPPISTTPKSMLGV